MSNGWTPERRAKQRKAIYGWRPWEKSTGPKTQPGKAAASRNSFKHGGTTATAKQERRTLLRLIGALDVMS
ncbi:MAG: hypothetical protein RL274_2867 [Pseudomonadota bacterium]|jgi:hypothetical protein